MIWALDSSFDAPSLAQAQAAAAAGVRVWGGYLATQPDVGLAAPWPRLAFWNVQQAGMRAIAFASGQDDPVALRQLAAEWDVLGVLDLEDGIRGDGAWVDWWLQASGFGLYGLCAVHYHPAPYRIVAQYPAGGCTGATWSPDCAPPPGEPHGWQCEGTHTDPVTGLSVDRSALDDWFGQAAPDPSPPALEARMVERFTLPDETLATLELRPDGTLSYTVVNPSDLRVLRRDNPLPGLWATIERCGVYQDEVYVRGTGAGTSAAGRLYQATTTWAPGATWALGPDPIA